MKNIVKFFEEKYLNHFKLVQDHIRISFDRKDIKKLLNVITKLEKKVQKLNNEEKTNTSK